MSKVVHLIEKVSDQKTFCSLRHVPNSWNNPNDHKGIQVITFMNGLGLRSGERIGKSEHICSRCLSKVKQ